MTFMKMDSFVHLETESAFSFLWGTFTPDVLVHAVKELGQRAVALTDRWGLYGVVRFYRAAVREGVQPIVGAKVQLEDGSWITLLVKEKEGYSNLCRLITAGLARRKRGRSPWVEPSELDMYSRGLICLVPGYGSRCRSLAARGEPASLIRLLSPLCEVFGKDFFIALRHHGSWKDHRANAGLFRAAKALGLKAVAVHQAAFLREDDYAVHLLLTGIQKRHHHRDVTPLPDPSFCLMSSCRIRHRIPWPEALEATGDIAEMCQGFKFPVGRLHPPKNRPVKEAEEAITRLSFKALASGRHPVSPEYILRLDKELRVVKDKGLSDFFLLVRDLVEFARSRDIRTSIRGSAAGSLLVHLLHGGPDPVKHGLLFERFMNDGRGDMPDIDIDFDSERRDEVISWLMDRFPERTAMVATIHSFKVRSAVRLAARALGYSLDEISRLTSCLPWSLRGIPLLDAIDRLPELRESPLRGHRRLLDMAAAIERLPFQASVHLGGVIISPGDILDWTPVARGNKGFPVGHLDKDDVDVLGLLKLDLLGLRMHTAMKKAWEIMERDGSSPQEPAPDDPKTYALLGSGDTLGVFQLESPGQRNLVGRLQPRCFRDLVAEISLFRPGPVKSDMVSRYVDRRNHREEVDYMHSDLLPVLEETYGVIVFQEQVLRIVHVFAGFSYADADAFRRAMTKDRSSGEMVRLRHAFIQGALKKGHPRWLAEEVYERVAAFAAYGFCKAHAVAFAEITYESAWIKANHPRAFYLGLLNAGHVGSYPPGVILNEARRKGIPVYPPHVNKSGLEYRAEGAGIRTPFTIVKGIGPRFAAAVVEERERGGPFISWEDFFHRVPISKKVWKTLALSGALEGLVASSVYRDITQATK